MASQQNPEPWAKNIKCRYFVNGVCKFGPDCKYSHDRSDPLDMVCRYYQFGKCSYGDKCRYDHIKLDKSDGSNADMSKNVPPKYSQFHSKCHDADWANAAEFVPGQQYALRDTSSYSAALKFGLTGSEEPLSTSPQKLNELCPYAMNGCCVNDENCAFVHGLFCDMCGLYILHPTDVEQQEKHKEECFRFHEETMKESFKIAKSSELSCGICMEVVWEKAIPKERKFGILENCNHAFCLDCIRKWRSAKAFNNTVVKACPECRVSSSFVTPSETWIEDKEEKKKLIEGYKSHLSAKACKYFDQGRGKCPFGANCFYLHAFPDGTKQDKSKIIKRNVAGKNGRRNIDPQTLWDFMETRAHGGNLSTLYDDDLDLFDLIYLIGEDSLSSDEDNFSVDSLGRFGWDGYLDSDD